MRYLILSGFLLILFFGNSQIISSSCAAHDSVVSRYKEDATLLTLRRIFLYGDSHKDSIQIPENYIDTVLNAMIAVYNATGIPERDTVIEVHNLSPLYNLGLHQFTIGADSGAIWMNALELGNLNTGFVELDQILQQNTFTLSNYIASPVWSTHFATLTTADTINIAAAIAPLYESVLIHYLTPEFNAFDGPNIVHIIHPNYVELRYHYRWGNCMAGCMYQRTWVFNVYYDCSVEFVESYNGPEPDASTGNIDRNNLIVSPNPFNDQVMISGIQGELEYTVFSFTGKKIISGSCVESGLIDLSMLPAGSYLLFVKCSDAIYRKQLVKN